MELEAELLRLTVLRRTQETALGTARQAQATLEKLKDLVQKLGSGLGQRQRNSTALQERLAAKQAEHASHADLLDRADEIEFELCNLEVLTPGIGTLGGDRSQLSRAGETQAAIP